MPQIDEAACWFTLLCAGPLPRRITKRLVHSWSIEAARPLAELYEQTPQALMADLSLTLPQAQALLASRPRASDARAELDQWAARGVGMVTRADVAYPSLLTDRLPEEKLPYLLFYAGSLVLATEPGIAVLGSGSPSPEGRTTTDALASSLADGGHHLVGGYARGVDRLAMESAVAHAGTAVVMLPIGFDGFESERAKHDRLFSDERLLVMSPYAPQDPYDDRRAMARLPLIGALSGAMALVEPEAESTDWAWVSDLSVAGGVLLIWGGSDAEIARQWVERGAQPFDEAAVAVKQLTQLFGSEDPDSAQPLDGGTLDASDLDPFGSAREALDALSRGGKVPSALAKRLRDMRPGD